MNHSGHSQPSTQQQGFRLRGEQMTRIETFTDAAFAFALTLLVISIDSIPSSVSALINLMRGIPAFLFSFALLMWFWHAHHIWSKRYGLDDTPTIWLSAALVFCILVFVYPLKFLYVIMMAWLSEGTLVTSLEPITQLDLRNAFIIYGIGFTVTCLILAAHYCYAWLQRKRLALNPLELLMTCHSIIVWCIPATLGIISISIAILATPGNTWPGMLYGSLALWMPLFGYFSDRQIKNLTSHEPEPN